MVDYGIEWLLVCLLVFSLARSLTRSFHVVHGCTYMSIVKPATLCESICISVFDSFFQLKLACIKMQDTRNCARQGCGFIIRTYTYIHTLSHKSWQRQMKKKLQQQRQLLHTHTHRHSQSIRKKYCWRVVWMHFSITSIFISSELHCKTVATFGYVEKNLCVRCTLS